MSIESEWSYVARIVWFSGGVVAVNNPEADVQIGAGLGGKIISSLRIPTYASLLAMLRQQGYSIVGVTFIESKEEAEGLRPSQFRALTDSQGWLAWNMHQQWSQIAHASGKRDNMSMMDVASRISSGLEYSEMRLLDLVEAYSIQLCGLSHSNASLEYRRFKDTNSFAVYKAIHALFWEMAVLRDTLSEFAAKFCFARTGIASLSGLIRSLHKESFLDPLAKQLMEAADKKTGGWLAMFSDYRNLFTHCAPMEQAAGIAFTVLDTRVVSPELSIPQIYYPLPPDVAELARRRSTGSLFMTFKELLDASSGRQHERTSEPDALDYLQQCFNQLVQLSAVLAARSPIDAEPMHFGPEDIIGKIRIINGC